MYNYCFSVIPTQTSIPDCAAYLFQLLQSLPEHFAIIEYQDQSCERESVHDL
jgi:hypothetical protein